VHEVNKKVNIIITHNDKKMLVLCFIQYNTLLLIANYYWDVIKNFQ
jgi:hypothetical protein